MQTDSAQCGQLEVPLLPFEDIKRQELEIMQMLGRMQEMHKIQNEILQQEQHQQPTSSNFFNMNNSSQARSPSPVHLE
jgi:hypothetical protein